MAIVAFFDFLSHASMHLPFNEGYLRLLHEAFPDDDILCGGAEEHVANLRSPLDDCARITFVPVDPLTVARTRDAQRPWRGRPAARRCWRQVERILGDHDVRFAALGGMDANLLAVFTESWSRRFDAPLHYVLHNHLAAAGKWRSRNPVQRWFDFPAVFSRPLPPNQAIVALELGLGDAVAAAFPVHADRLVTLEHPVLEREWAPLRMPPTDRPIRVGFVGNCGPGKGFDVFVELARRFSGDAFEFHAIGRADPATAHLDLSPLARAPAPEGLDRERFVRALERVDLVCLPLPGGTRFVASGSIIDAFAAGKPVLSTRDQMSTAIEWRYGDFGVLADRREDIATFFTTFDNDHFRERYERWLSTLERIRHARAAAPLARRYRADIGCRESPED